MKSRRRTVPRRPLSSYLIVDLTEGVAAGICGQMLADIGCQVVSVRDSVAAVAATEDLVRESLDRGKRVWQPSRVDQGDRARLARLIGEADVLLIEETDGHGGDWANWCLAVAPAGSDRITTAKVELGGSYPLPLDASERARVMCAEATTGLAELQGGFLTRTRYLEHGVGASLAIGVLGALLARQGGRAAGDVSVSLTDTALLLQAAPIAEFSATGWIHRQSAYVSRFPVVGIFDASDGPFYLAAFLDKEFEATVKVIDRPDLAADPLYATPALRATNRDTLRAVLAEAFASSSCAEWIDRFTQAGVMVGRLRDAESVLSYEQVAANDILRPHRTSLGQNAVLPRLPYRVSNMAHAASSDATDSAITSEQLSELLTRRGDPRLRSARAPGDRRDTMATSVGPLKGVRIVDLTHAVAGPSATQILADLGATVWKIENPPDGDFLRGLSRFGFESFNRNKHSIALDLKSVDGHAALVSLIEQADLVVHSQRRDVMVKLGLGPDDVHAINPRAVYAALSGFGPVGPDRDRRGVDALLQAESGLASLQGAVLGNVSMVDQLSGLFFAFGMLAADMKDPDSAQGAEVHVSLLDSSLFLEAAEIGLASLSPAERAAHRGEAVAIEVIEASDGPLVAVLDGTGEVTTADQLRASLGPQFVTRPREHLVALLAAVRVASAPVLDYDKILDGVRPLRPGRYDVVMTAKGELSAIPQPAYAFTRPRKSKAAPAPIVGQDTAEVFATR